MTLPGFFKSTNAALNQDENLMLYRQQIAEKRLHLNHAQGALDQALQLVEDFKNNISLLAEQMSIIDKKIEVTDDGLVLQMLKLQKEQQEQFIENSNAKLEPFVERINLMIQNIQVLEQEIMDLEEQERIFMQQEVANP